MKIAVGADHAGFDLKNQIRDLLEREGHQVRDLGTGSAASVDYPDFAQVVSEAVANGDVDRGILVCGTGAGMAIAANKIPGIRAAVGFTPEQVRILRAHNDNNVLALGARFTQPAEALEMAGIFITAPFEGGRHERRVNKIAQIEKLHE